MKERRGSSGEQLVDDIKETRRYWEVKEEAQDRSLGRTRFGRGREEVYTEFWWGNLMERDRLQDDDDDDADDDHYNDDAHCLGVWVYSIAGLNGAEQK